jgi:hypothetical protein
MKGFVDRFGYGVPYTKAAAHRNWYPIPHCERCGPPCFDHDAIHGVVRAALCSSHNQRMRVVDQPGGLLKAPPWAVAVFLNCLQCREEVLAADTPEAERVRLLLPALGVA